MGGQDKFVAENDTSASQVLYKFPVSTSDKFRHVSKNGLQIYTKYNDQHPKGYPSQEQTI